MDFPQFRKLTNGLVYYKIVNERQFEEIQIVGTKYFYYEHKVDKYPEIIRIQEMLTFDIPGIIETSQSEFDILKSKC